MTTMPKKKTAKGKNEIQILFSEPLKLNQTGTSSVDIKRNSKGSTEFSVKVYALSPKDAEREATKIYNSLRKQYPVD